MKTRTSGVEPRRPYSGSPNAFTSHMALLRAGVVYGEPPLGVSGPFPQKALDELRKDDWYKARLDEARNAYLANRKNGVEGDSPAHPFPGDGAYSWDTPESEEESAIRYTEGPQDKAWMEARDRNYVFRLETEGLLDKEEPNLKTEVPSLYAEVMAKRQGRGTEEKMVQGTEARQAEQVAARKREQEAVDARVKAEAEAAKARAAEIAATASAKKTVVVPIPSRVLPPLVSRVNKLLAAVKGHHLSQSEQEEVDEIEAYNQHFTKEALTQEAREELTRVVGRLNEIINAHNTQPDLRSPAASTVRSASSSDKVEQWRRANAVFSPDAELPAYGPSEVGEDDDDVSVASSQFYSTEPDRIAGELIKRIRKHGLFSITIEENESIEIRCKAGKVDAITVQALKQTLSELFEKEEIELKGHDTIILPWDGLRDKQVRRFREVFLRHQGIAKAKFSVLEAVEEKHQAESEYLKALQAQMADLSLEYRHKLECLTQTLASQDALIAQQKAESLERQQILATQIRGLAQKPQATLTTGERQLLQQLQREQMAAQDAQQAKEKILAHPSLRIFYLTIQSKLNEMFAKKLLNMHNNLKDKAANSISLLSELVPLPGLGMVTGIISAVLNKASDKQAQKKHAQWQAVSVSISGFETLSEVLAFELTQRYLNRIQVLVPETQKKHQAGAKECGEAMVERMIKGIHHAKDEEALAQHPKSALLLAVRQHNIETHGKWQLAFSDSVEHSPLSIADLCSHTGIQTLTPRQRAFDAPASAASSKKAVVGKFFTDSKRFGYVGGTEDEAVAMGMKLG